MGHAGGLQLPGVGGRLSAAPCRDIWLWVKSNGIPFWGRCTTHLSLWWGLVDVHWGYDLPFDPWPFVLREGDRLFMWLWLFPKELGLRRFESGCFHVTFV